MAIAILRNILGGSPSTGGTWTLQTVVTSPVSEPWFIKYTTDVAHSVYTTTSCPSVSLPYSLGAANYDPYLDTSTWTPGVYTFRYTTPASCGSPLTADVTLTIADRALINDINVSPAIFCNTTPINTTLTVDVDSVRACATSLPAPYTGSLVYTFQESNCPSGLWTNLAPPQSGNTYIDGTLGFNPPSNSNYYKFYRLIIEDPPAIVCNTPTNLVADTTKQISGDINAEVTPCTDVCIFASDSSKILNLNSYWGAGTTAPIPRSCTAGQGANFKYIDTDGRFGAAGSVMECKTSASDLVQREFISFADGLTINIGYRVTNHLTIPITAPLGCVDSMPNWNLNCNEEANKQFRIVRVAGGSDSYFTCDGSLEDLPNGIIANSTTYNMYSDLIGSPSLTTPVRTYTWRLSSFTPASPSFPDPYFNLCGQGFMVHSTGALPVTGCGTPSTGTTIEFDIGIPNGVGEYVFVLEADNPGCAAGCPPTQHFLTIETIFA